MFSTVLGFFSYRVLPIYLTFEFILLILAYYIVQHTKDEGVYLEEMKNSQGLSSDKRGPKGNFIHKASCSISRTKRHWGQNKICHGCDTVK